MGFIKWVYLVFRTVLSALAVVPIAIWRIKWLRYTFLFLVVALGISTYLFYGNLPAPVNVYDVVWLKQGWTEDQRERYYQTDQGTLIMPYTWFLALEVPPTLRIFDNTNLFRANDNATRYRLIPDPRPKYNPYGLPVGLAKSTVPDDLVEDLGLGHKEWLSFSCAACHTGQITYKGLGIRVDGMPAMWNFSQFSQNMTATLATTRLLPSKFDRFAQKVLQLEGKQDTSEERQKLKQQIDQYAKWPLIQDALITGFHGTYPTTEGPGRTDALGRGANGQFSPLCRTLTSQGLSLTYSKSCWQANVREGDGPVSFPPLWYTHDYDWVQSTTSIRQPLGRNVTESWGVNVIVDTWSKDPNKLFRSTHPMFNLFWMETLISVLEHPRWPSSIFGPIDEKLAERGRYLYEDAVWNNPRKPEEEIECSPDANAHMPCNKIREQKGYCARCHSPLAEPETNDRYHTPPPDPGCKSPLWQLTLYKLDVLGTDPNDAQNFYKRTQGMSPGQGPFRTAFEQSPYADKSKENLGLGIGNGLQFVTDNVMNWWFKANNSGMEDWVKAGVFASVPEGRATMEGFRENLFRAPLAYPARPMAGYWATAPFLHNHSIKNVYELLSPVEERSKVFWVGDTEFDPVNLGFISSRFRRGFKFDSSKAGNSNRGHEFSAQPGDPAKPGVIGPLLSKEDRMAIVEYMKKISDVPPLQPCEAARRHNLLEKMKPYYEGQVSGAYEQPGPGYAPYQEPYPEPYQTTPAKKNK